MKSLLLQIKIVEVYDKWGKQLKKSAAASRYITVSCEDGHTSDGNTSGAINSDDDPGSIVYCRDTEPTTSPAQVTKPATPVA